MKQYTFTPTQRKVEHLHLTAIRKTTVGMHKVYGPKSNNKQMEVNMQINYS